MNDKGKVKSKYFDSSSQTLCSIPTDVGLCNESGNQDLGRQLEGVSWVKDNDNAVHNRKIDTCKMSTSRKEARKYISNSEDELSFTNNYTTAIEKRLNPKNKTDFKLLSLELTYWQQQKFAEIDGKPISDIKKNGLRLNILSQETKLIRKIDSLKRGVLQENELKDLQSFLQEKTVLPLWNVKDGTQIEVETVDCRTNAELISLYYKLSGKDKTVAERKNILKAVKRKTENHPMTSLAKDICDLVDREYEMLNREMKICSSLRLRLSNMFLNYLELEVK